MRDFDLLTCPFCGGDPEIIMRTAVIKEYFVKCTNEDCRSNAGIALDIAKAHKTQESAARHWNTTIDRAPVKKFHVRKV